jgi:hypothetical protein
MRLCSACRDELIDVIYEFGAVKIRPSHLNAKGILPTLISLRQCREKNCVGHSSLWNPQ